MRYRAWGFSPIPPQQAVRYSHRSENFPDTSPRTSLPFGNGRSYGDVCLNPNGTLIDCRPLDRFISFDPHAGVIRCEAGVLLSEIHELIVPHGWFLPVTPGTQYVTLGGAIANDVHGKNHHRAGTFGLHVRCLELLRSDESRRICSPSENIDWFSATIGGLGLTGVITWAEIELKHVHGPMLAQQTLRCANLGEFFRLSDESDTSHEYTVAWVDCAAKGPALGRGLFMRANHSPDNEQPLRKVPRRSLSMPWQPPFSLVNRISLRVFNSLYYNRPRPWGMTRATHYQPFFYPLDSIDNWNRIYGRHGLLQYQCVLPEAVAESGLREILGRIAMTATGSFLAVLKVFGNKRSPGMLSFPRPGATLALDFPAGHPRVRALLDQLDDVTREAGGAVYPAKDARMRAPDFQVYFPRWHEFKSFVDPQFSSGFWRRVTGEIACEKQ